MADSSKNLDQPSSVKFDQGVHTFVIHGGEPFEIKLTGKLGPALIHDGSMTMWKMVGTDAEAASIESMVAGPLIGAHVKRYTEVETDEMLAIRRERLQGAAPSES